MLQFLSRLTDRVTSLDKFFMLSQVTSFDLSLIALLTPRRRL